MNAVLLAFESVMALVALILVVLWLRDPNGPYEAWAFVSLLFGGTFVEIFRRWLSSRAELPRQELSPDLVLTPINERGSNIRSEDKSGFFVQVRFHLKATADADILDLDLDYCNSSYFPTEEDVLVDGQDIGTDRYGRLRTPIHLTKGHIRRITLIRRFPKEPHVADYGNVLITAEASFLAHREVERKEWRFKLAPGGELKPVEARRPIAPIVA